MYDQDWPAWYAAYLVAHGIGDLLGQAITAEQLARLLNTLGWVYQDLFSLDLALQHDQASLDLARTGTPRPTEAEGYAQVNLATTQLLLGRSDQTRQALDAGLALAEHETFMRWRYFTRLILVQGQLALGWRSLGSWGTGGQGA